MSTPTPTAIDMEARYAERMNRYVAAMHLGEPDCVPLRPFAAEITARHAGFTCQEVTHDYRKAFDALLQCCRDYDWDATVPSMVYVWTGLTQAAGLTYYGVPGIDVDADVCFQYREPAEDAAFMKREEYDELIADPVRFLYETWLPRVSTEYCARGEAVTFRNNLAYVKSSMAMMEYFAAFGPQIERMRRETGTPSAICGMLKAPLDILADKMRGYIGLVYDLREIPDKVQAACEALMPHLGYLALTGADPLRQAPIPIWMHRGCTPFISKKHFTDIYWPTLKPIVEALWAQGNQTLFYAEGKWDAHLEAFAELPEHSIVYHLDRGNPERTHEVLGRKFCLSGGVSNVKLAFGTQEDVREEVRRLIELLGHDGRYIVDASAIMQNDATVPNLRAMSEAAREFGRYRSVSSPTPATVLPTPSSTKLPDWITNAGTHPGVCRDWSAKLAELPAMRGDAALARRIWEGQEGLAYLYIWHILLSF
jgi:hypothetical protein